VACISNIDVFGDEQSRISFAAEPSCGISRHALKL
jgi:hypothetical protein